MLTTTRRLRGNYWHALFYENIRSVNVAITFRYHYGKVTSCCLPTPCRFCCPFHFFANLKRKYKRTKSTRRWCRSRTIRDPASLPSIESLQYPLSRKSFVHCRIPASSLNARKRSLKPTGTLGVELAAIAGCENSLFRKFTFLSLHS